MNDARRMYLAAACAAVLVIWGCSTSPAPKAQPDRISLQAASEVPGPADAATAKVRQRLDQQVLSAEASRFERVEFQSFLTFLRESSGLDIDVNWSALDAVGVSKETPVTLRMKDPTYKQLLLAALEATSPKARLGYHIDNGVITVSTFEDLTRTTVTVRAYDVTDLAQDHGGMTTDQVVAKIKKTVDPDSWQPKGKTGTVNVLNKHLVVTQSYANHMAITDLLERMRSQ